MARRTKIYKEWEYFQPNPKEEKAGDCQIRAVCATTGLDWYQAFDVIAEYCREHCRVWYNNDGINYLVDKLGFEKPYTIKREKGKKAKTIQKFCQENPKGTFIVTVAHHVVGVVDGKFYDSWCSAEECIYRVYKKKEA